MYMYIHVHSSKCTNHTSQRCALTFDIGSSGGGGCVLLWEGRDGTGLGGYGTGDSLSGTTAAACRCRDNGLRQRGGRLADDWLFAESGSLVGDVDVGASPSSSSPVPPGRWAVSFVLRVTELVVASNALVSLVL